MNKVIAVLISLLMSIATVAQVKKNTLIADFEIPASVCLGDSVEFINKSTGSDTLLLQWNFGDGYETTHKSNVRHLYHSPETFTVTLQVFDAVTKEKSTKTTKELVVLNKPEISLSYDREAINDTVSMFIGQTVTVSLNETLADYRWYRNSAGQWAELASGQSFDTRDAGYYRAWASNVVGCAAETYFWIELKEIPESTAAIEVENNILTPNGDGINDNLMVKDPQNYVEPILLKVFSKFGTLVYENQQYSNDWNGIDNAGAELSTGTYYYILQSENRKGKKGFIDIIRSN